MAALDDGFGGYLALFAAGFLVTEVWRWLGLLVGSRLDVAGEVFQWVRAVATALVAGMVARMLLFPAGALADIALTVRLTAFAGGFVCYYALKRNLARRRCRAAGARATGFGSICACHPGPGAARSRDPGAAHTRPLGPGYLSTANSGMTEAMRCLKPSSQPAPPLRSAAPRSSRRYP